MSFFEQKFILMPLCMKICCETCRKNLIFSQQYLTNSLLAIPYNMFCPDAEPALQTRCLMPLLYPEEN